MHLQVVNYILYGNGKPIQGISDTSIQLVRTCLVLNWYQEKKSSPIEKTHAWERGGKWAFIWGEKKKEDLFREGAAGGFSGGKKKKSFFCWKENAGSSVFFGRGVQKRKRTERAAEEKKTEILLAAASRSLW